VLVNPTRIYEGEHLAPYPRLDDEGGGAQGGELKAGEFLQSFSLFSLPLDDAIRPFFHLEFRSEPIENPFQPLEGESSAHLEARGSMEENRMRFLSDGSDENGRKGGERRGEKERGEECGRLDPTGHGKDVGLPEDKGSAPFLQPEWRRDLMIASFPVPEEEIDGIFVNRRYRKEPHVRP